MGNKILFCFLKHYNLQSKKNTITKKNKSTITNIKFTLYLLLSQQRCIPAATSHIVNCHALQYDCGTHTGTVFTDTNHIMRLNRMTKLVLNKERQ